jgi:polysaccharide export outer membrane protein
MRFEPSPVLGLCVATIGALITATAALADYKIQRGDVLELSVAGIPDLRTKMTVGLDGEVAVPMAQPVNVAGMTLAEAQKIVKSELSQRLYHQRTLDGRESTTAIPPESISLMISDYRPIYVDGDVSKPGSQIYRPGLTVRQAVSLAGGYEIMRFRTNNPFLESADLRNDYQSLWLEFVREQGKIWRLQTELNGATATLEDLTEAPLPASELDRARVLARQELETQRTRNKGERAYLEQATRVAEDQIKILKARQQSDEANVDADSEEYQKLKNFSARGNLPMTRLSEARRLFLFSSTQALQTTAQLTEATRQRDLARRELARYDEFRRLDILRQLNEAGVALGSIRSRLQAVSEKIGYTGIIRSQLARGKSRPMILIKRADSPGQEAVAGTEDSELFPGDTVEIALKTELPHSDTTN